MMDAIKGLKEKLEAVTTEAASAKDMHDAAIKAKDGACACTPTFACVCAGVGAGRCARLV
jgi:hypothetical protein